MMEHFLFYGVYKGIDGLAEKFIPVIKTFINELGELSWVALVAMLSVGGILMLMGNEFGAKKVCKNALYGFLLIQVASMLI
jgi:hypothetical protein